MTPPLSHFCHLFHSSTSSKKHCTKPYWSRYTDLLRCIGSDSPDGRQLTENSCLLIAPSPDLGTWSNCYDLLFFRDVLHTIKTCLQGHPSFRTYSMVSKLHDALQVRISWFPGLDSWTIYLPCPSSLQRGNRYLSLNWQVVPFTGVIRENARTETGKI